VKFLTYKILGGLRLGALDPQKGVLDLVRASRTLNGRDLPETLRGLVAGGEQALAAARAAFEAARKGGPADLWTALSDEIVATPLPGATKNIFCVGRNYKLHIEEMARAKNVAVSFPKFPEYFTKPPTAVVGHGDGVEPHLKYTQKLDYEVELAVVIGKRGRNIAEADALDFVFGYTVLNDVTARDAQINHGQFFKGKSFDTFCPIGPYVVTKDEFGDWSGHRLWLSVNGKIRQDSNTSDLLFGVPKIISSLSEGITLEPGDVICTGTPAGVASGMEPPVWLQPGDVMEACVEGIGVLRNKVLPA
jgi:2-keto-4-pentenoate hydratase/2-oxohepta-3-ene-1,7-dioic acid hydratase in catechol pathway